MIINDDAEIRKIMHMAKEIVMLCESVLNSRTGASTENITAKAPDFGSKTDVFKYVLAKYPEEGLHISMIVEEASALGLKIEKLNASGILRRQAANGNHFVALGRNRFKLKEE